MTIGIAHIRMRLPSQTLKEKRTIVKSVVERLRQRYNVSVAEVEDLDTPGLTTIAAACVSNDARHADEQLQEVIRAIQTWRLDAEIIEVETELL